jgi:RNA polymerase sigma-70 factor (family 1)
MPQLQDQNDQILLEKLRQGNVEAFEQIFNTHWHSLYVIAKAKVHSHHEAEEIIQHIFSALWEKREALQINNLSSYLGVAVRNRIINLIRSRITHKKYWDHYKHFIPQHQEITENTVAFDHLNEAVEMAVNRLPQKSREVFKLSRMEGRSNAEIANQLHLSEKAIEYHLTSSLRKLRLHLKDFMVIAIFLLVC